MGATIGRRIIDGLLDAIFPIKCLSCGLFFHRRSMPPHSKNHKGLLPFKEGDHWCKSDVRQLMAVLFINELCDPCCASLEPMVSPICIDCGRMFKSREGLDHRCGVCQKSRGKQRTIRSVGVYRKVLREVIHAFKYHGKLQCAKPLSGLLFAYAFLKRETSISYRDIDLVLPVPLHIRRLRERGFNQAYMLVKYWPQFAIQMGLDLKFEVEREVLKRHRWTESQVGFKRDMRRKNVAGAFSVTRNERVEKKRILLVDDVYTTGATVSECTRILLKAGAVSVDVLTLARHQSI